ncbi:MAG: quinohemoprotein amine dehydrogenase maturation protein [Steroidobacteraceae bacterium]
MPQSLVLNRSNGHIVRFDGRAMLFHVPTSALFELDALGDALIGEAENGGMLDAGTLAGVLGQRFGEAEVAGLLERLTTLGVLQPAEGVAAINAKRVDVQAYPLSTIVLNVNTGCNLGCTYCYKEDLATPARGEKMGFEVAAKSVDLLLRQSVGRKRIGVVFFGGEPLTNVGLIREVVAYAEQRAAEAGRQVDFSVTTNGTLLDEATIDWFDEHRFGITVSMDGPKVIHDRNRRTVGNRGTYDVVARKARLLLSRYRSKQVGARVTLTRGTTEVEAIHAHLRDGIGFHEVGYAPVTSAEKAAHALTPEELTAVHEGFERLGGQYLAAALRGENTGFSNLHQLMTDLHEGRRKALPCGAGVGLLAVDRSGGLNLCHRFTGSELPTFGTVDEGIDAGRLGGFLGRAADRDGTWCATCRIRNLCAGGCYHESYARHGDPLARTYHYCNLLRRWVDFGIRVYVEIGARNPAFFPRHIEPRRVDA